MNRKPSLQAVRAVPSFQSLAVLAAAVGVLAAGPAAAQLPIPASTQFDLTGFIQAATLDPSCATSAHCGGTITVNGHVVIIPKETIVILPASAYTWQELFALAPAPYTGTYLGMALSDVPAPLTTYEAHVVGNRVIGATDTYIAGLVHISQQDLNSGAGFINFMDYSTGEMRVGGILNDPTTGARVRINDPVGRFGRATPVPDPRFAVDDANPTIVSATGFPMCFPRAAPSGVVGAPETDPLCPQANRPGGTIINMSDPALGIFPNPNLQVPLQVGDYVMFSGTLVTDRLQPTIGPMPSALTEPGVGTYVAAHTITDNAAVYTFPGTNPAYVSIEVSLLGTGGLTVIGAGEAVIRTRFEGMTTDPTRNVHVYGVDLDPLTGAPTDRDWGVIAVDPGPPTGAVKGRWRFRPPCAVFGSVVTKPDKECVMNQLGVFLPATREVRAVIEGLQSQGAPPAPAVRTALTAANGLLYGQYHAPIGELIFPENLPGTPIVENNFNTIPFLASGGYTSSTGTVVGQLNPWPSSVVPSPACIVPTASVNGPYTVAAGGAVSLLGSATGTAPLTVLWATPAAGALSSTGVLNPTFTAPLAAGPIALSLTVTNACGSSTSSGTVTVNAAAAPTVNHVTPIAVLAGTPSVTIPLSGTDPNGLALTFAATQTGTPALTGFVVNNPTPRGTTATITFGVPALPVGQTVPSVINLTITATNAGGTTSAPEFTTVTINPVADAVLVTNVTYRTTKQRLVITATSSVVSPNVALTLRKYVTSTGLTYDPSVLGATFTNNGAGLYTLTLVGAPQPAVPPALPIVVQSNLGGVSAPHQLDTLRQ